MLRKRKDSRQRGMPRWILLRAWDLHTTFRARHSPVRNCVAVIILTHLYYFVGEGILQREKKRFMRPSVSVCLSLFRRLFGLLDRVPTPLKEPDLKDRETLPLGGYDMVVWPGTVLVHKGPETQWLSRELRHCNNDLRNLTWKTFLECWSAPDNTPLQSCLFALMATVGIGPGSIWILR